MALLGAATLLGAGLLGAADASASPTATITIEYDGTSVDGNGVITPSVIFRGTGFLPLPAGSEKKRGVILSVTNTADVPGRDWFGYDFQSTCATKVCTHTVPVHCYTGYQDGDLRPFRIYLHRGPNDRHRIVQCGDLMIAGAWTMTRTASTVTTPNWFRSIFPATRTSRGHRCP